MRRDRTGRALPRKARRQEQRNAVQMTSFAEKAMIYGMFIALVLAMAGRS